MSGGYMPDDIIKITTKQKIQNSSLKIRYTVKLTQRPFPNSEWTKSTFAPDPEAGSRTRLLSGSGYHLSAYDVISKVSMCDWYNVSLETGGTYKQQKCITFTSLIHLTSKIIFKISELETKTQTQFYRTAMRTPPPFEYGLLRDDLSQRYITPRNRWSEKVRCRK